MLAGSAAVVQVNTDASPALAARFKVSGVPVIFLLRQGKVVDQLSGARPPESVVKWFRSHEAG
jgi:thioredoxin 2